MRAVTKAIACAFAQREKLSMGNTMTNGVSVFVHGNEVARWNCEALEINLCGWVTPLTCERINGILKVCGSSELIARSKGDPFLWNGTRARPIERKGWVKVAIGQIAEAAR